MSQPVHPKGHSTVDVTLEAGWHEPVTRSMAVERLRSRPLRDDDRRRIEENIPELTHHYLTFAGRAFREYVDFGEGFAHVALFLPMEPVEGGYRVIVPMYRSERYPDGRQKNLIGIDEHIFHVDGEQIIENNVARSTFEPIREPVQLQVETTMLRAEAHPEGSICCDACEWVHSGLDIHCADWLCCLGCC